MDTKRAILATVILGMAIYVIGKDLAYITGKDE